MASAKRQARVLVKRACLASAKGACMLAASASTDTPSCLCLNRHVPCCRNRPQLAAADGIDAVLRAMGGSVRAWKGQAQSENQIENIQTL